MNYGTRYLHNSILQLHNAIKHWRYWNLEVSKRMNCSMHTWKALLDTLCVVTVTQIQDVFMRHPVYSAENPVIPTLQYPEFRDVIGETASCSGQAVQ